MSDTKLPFSSLELERRWTELVGWARRADDTRIILETRELNKELKDAYKLVLADNKWQVAMKIKDLWIWTVKEEEIKSKKDAENPVKNAEVSGNQNVSE